MIQTITNTRVRTTPLSAAPHQLFCRMIDAIFFSFAVIASIVISLQKAIPFLTDHEIFTESEYTTYLAAGQTVLLYSLKAEPRERKTRPAFACHCNICKRRVYAQQAAFAACQSA